MNPSSRNGRRAGRVSIVLFAVSLSSLTVGARDAAAQGGKTGSIAGTVVARDGGRPVADATVTVEGTTLTAIANGVGRFRLEGVAAGQAMLVASGPGFLQLRIPSVQVSANQTTPLIIELEVTPNILERVQVTATKSELSIGDVAAQADIVDRSTIDTRNDQSLVQAVSRVPGVVVATQLGMFESVQLRGMPRDGNEFTNTLLMIDGVPQVDSRNSARTVGLPIHDAGAHRGDSRSQFGALWTHRHRRLDQRDNRRSPPRSRSSVSDFTGGQFGMAKGVVKASGPVGHVGRVLRVGRNGAQPAVSTSRRPKTSSRTGGRSSAS